MIPAVILGWFRTNPRNMWVMIGMLAAIGLLVFVYVKGRSDNARKVAAARAVAVAEAVTLDARADSKSADMRLQDAATVAALREELTDAVSQVDDTVPDPAAVALGCQRLRNSGADVSRLPACR